MKTRALFLAGLLLPAALAACVNPVREVPEPPGPVTGPVRVSCEPPSEFGGYLFWMDAPAVPPGASLVLQPWFSPQPGVMEPVSAECLGSVEISGPAKLGEDGRTVVVDGDAAAGAAVQVQGKVGEAGVSGRILVFHPETQPLVGVWHQPEEECEGAEPIRELMFAPDGRFTLTWLPFEVYKDYWGGYTFNSGVLAMKPDGGNYIPADATLAGDVQLDSGTLTIDPAILGSPPSGKPCAAPFRR